MNWLCRLGFHRWGLPEYVEGRVNNYIHCICFHCDSRKLFNFGDGKTYIYPTGSWK